jgi:hypothetical protein
MREPLREDLSIEDAINVANVAYSCLPHDANRDYRELVAAARRLVRHITEQREELERERARRHGLAREDARAEGHPLIEGRDAGGRRDFLNGRAVHAGAGLYLLTERGWYPVRYESSMPAGPSVLYLALPGAQQEMIVTIPWEAYFAWPDELGR